LAKKVAKSPYRVERYIIKKNTGIAISGENIIYHHRILALGLSEPQNIRLLLINQNIPTGIPRLRNLHSELPQLSVPMIPTIYTNMYKIPIAMNIRNCFM
jgi:hypothetical protein